MMGVKTLSAFTLLLLASAAWRVAQADQAPIPRLSGAVVDEAQVLPPDLREQLDLSLRDFQKQFGPQIVLLTVPDLLGEPVEAFAIRVAEQWKLGDARRDDGLLVVVAPRDRAARIEVGQGLEGQIPDARAGRILQEVMIPRFRDGNWPAGVVEGLQSIAQALGGELRSMPQFVHASPRGRISFLPFLILFLFLFPHIFGRRGRRGSTAGAAASGFLLGSLLGGGRGGDGGGGFGGFGGGGGGFSGGGASGRW